MAFETAYNRSSRSDQSSRFPEKHFDPKAVTRASWEPKPPKPKHDGPLVSFNRHPDAHMCLPSRAPEMYMSPRTKAWIIGMRWVLMAVRILQLVAASGLLTLWILLKDMDAVTGWVMRIVTGISLLHICYAIYHLSRKAADRSPGSSAAYSVFAAIFDLTTMITYAFGLFMIRKESNEWHIRLDDQTLADVIVTATSWSLIGDGILHSISFAICLYLGVMFRKIGLMPPDRNPLEDHLTARPQAKRYRASVSTIDTQNEDKRRLSTPMEAHRKSGVPYENLSRPPSIPFTHTRMSSQDSFVLRSTETNNRHSNLSNVSTRSSLLQGEKLLSGQPRKVAGEDSLGSYTALSPQQLRYSSTGPGLQDLGQSRTAKFTETWAPSSSIISRTKKRNTYEPLDALPAGKTDREPGHDGAYSPVPRRYAYTDSSDSEDADKDTEKRTTNGQRRSQTSHDVHPNPLRSNPADDETTSIRPKYDMPSPRRQTPFRTRPHKEEYLNAASSQPVAVGGVRNVSSGHDYNLKTGTGVLGRRNVSGKLAEEGLAGQQTSRWTVK